MVLALLAEGALGPAPCTPAFRQGLLAPRPLRLASPLQIWVSQRQTLLCAPPTTALPAGLASEASHAVTVSANPLLSPAPPRPCLAAPLGPAWASAGPSGSILWAGSWADCPTHIRTGAQGPQAGVGTGSSSRWAGISVYQDSTPDPPSTPHGHSWRKARLTLCQEMRLSITMPPATLGKFTKNQFPERQFADGQVSN